jgi:predicted RNase H-like HicB family nuclease
MSTAEAPDPDEDAVRFVREETGEVTAIHVPTEVASVGDTESEALRALADALDSHFGRGESIDDPEGYLDDLGVDAEIGSHGKPPWESE